MGPPVNPIIFPDDFFKKKKKDGQTELQTVLDLWIFLSLSHCLCVYIQTLVSQPEMSSTLEKQTHVEAPGKKLKPTLRFTNTKQALL